MAFQFRFEKLLSYRQHLREKAELKLARAQQNLKRARLLLEKDEESLHLTRKRLESRLKKRIVSEELQNHADYMTDLKERIRADTSLVVERERIIEEKREELLLKAKQYRVIEKLKEKDYEKWKHIQLQAEQKRMNEVAVSRHGRPSWGKEKSS
ncbi:flagellar export protein FliJ [Thermodesulfobacteriota bacterium]